VGDIIIGTIVEIKNKRWKIDINSECEAYLHLNSTYLPE
jgi:exosome complex RNA-binding protein Rrp4